MPRHDWLAGARRHFTDRKRLQSVLQQIADDYCRDNRLPAVGVSFGRGKVQLVGFKGQHSDYSALYLPDEKHIRINTDFIDDLINSYRPGMVEWQKLLSAIYHELQHHMDYCRHPQWFKDEENIQVDYDDMKTEKRATQAEHARFEEAMHKIDNAEMSLLPRNNPSRKRVSQCR